MSHYRAQAKPKLPRTLSEILREIAKKGRKLSEQDVNIIGQAAIHMENYDKLLERRMPTRNESQLQAELDDLKESVGAMRKQIIDLVVDWR